MPAPMDAWASARTRGRLPLGRAALALALAGVTLALGAGAALGAAGSSGVGDPYFPRAGNGGYGVKHYEIELDVQPGANMVDARIAVRARARRSLSRFNLDFRGPAITELAVDGEAAEFERHGQELQVTPAEPLARGAFRVGVEYAGSPQPVTDPDGSTEGWVQTSDGTAALGEPQGTPSWLPCNDHPTDKATFDFEITVPNSHVGVANGRLVSEREEGLRTTYAWRERDPMATYLAMVTTGVYDLQRETQAGIPAWTAIDPSQQGTTDLSASGSMLRFLHERFGPYPFDSTGAVVDLAPQFGYALETQTRPFYSRAPGEATIVHELAHQWYGDSVSPAGWREIWLNEGFATYSEWLWDAHTGGPTPAETLDDLYATPASDREFWNPPPGDPGRANMFDGTVYTRGAMTLQALRERIGSPAFVGTLRDWAGGNRFGNVSTDDLIRLAEARSGERLDGLFRRWLYEPGKPRR